MNDIEVTIPPVMRQQLRSLEAALGSSMITVPLLAAAQVVRNAAIPKAAFLTGTLRRSIRTEVVDRTSVVVGSDVPYARRQELGFEGPDKLGRVYHQGPRPYLRPAADETHAEQLAEVKRATLDLLKEGLR